jgi:hypothetical protein
MPTDEVHTWGTTGNLLEVDVLRQCLVTRVHLQDGDAALNIRAVHRHLTIETTRSQERLIEYIWPIGCCDDDDPGVTLRISHCITCRTHRPTGQTPTGKQATSRNCRKDAVLLICCDS